MPPTSILNQSNGTKSLKEGDFPAHERCHSPTLESHFSNRAAGAGFQRLQVVARPWGQERQPVVCSDADAALQVAVQLLDVCLPVARRAGSACVRYERNRIGMAFWGAQPQILEEGHMEG